MFWTVLKIVVFLGLIAALTFGVERFMQTDYGVRIAVADLELNLGPVQAVLAALVLVLAVWLVLKLAGFLVAVLRFINGDDTAISRYFDRARKRRGLEALSDGFLALAAGEGDTAVARARKAEKLLENRTLTNLLMAQAAQTKGDTALAGEYYKRLLVEDRSRFVGVQGLLRQQLDAGEDAKARQLAEKALALRPAHGGTQDTLLQLQNSTGDWQGARRTLSEVKRSGRLPKDVFYRRDAVLALQQAQAYADEGSDAMAQDLAIEAHRLSPGLVPAAVMAARAHIARGAGRKASNLLKKTWKLAPHPELAQVYAEIDPAETPAARVKRFEKLFSYNNDDEAKLTRAEILIAAEDFPAARRAVGNLHETAPSQRVMTIMAAIERGEGSDDAVVRGWLARALTAPRGPQWVCDSCQHIHARWVAICEHCGAFDTLTWKRPPDSSGPSATGTEILPLIVGALQPPPRDATAGDADDDAPETHDASTRDATAETPAEDVTDAQAPASDTASDTAGDTATDTVPEADRPAAR